MRLLALDLGLKCGWALFGGGARLASGTWHLAEDGGSRFNALHIRLLSLVQSHGVTTIAYESVHRHAGTDAAHVFGGWLAILELVAGRTRAKVVGVRPQDIHAAAAVRTDRRRAPKGASKTERRQISESRRKNNKSAVIEAAHARGWPVKDDNEADACFAGLAAQAEGACQ